MSWLCLKPSLCFIAHKDTTTKQGGSLEHFEVLIQYETLEIDGQTDSGVTPLMMAVYSGNV